MARPHTETRKGKGSPTSLPQGTPTSLGTFDHSFTLQAVMAMQKDLGVLGEKIDRMRQDVTDLGKKVDENSERVTKINTKLAWVAGIAAGVTAVAALIWAFVSVVPWERITIAPAASETVGKKGAAEAAPSG